MILVFGGTTEGRTAAATLDRAGKPFYYSTKEGEQNIDAANCISISGELPAEDIEKFIKTHDIKLIVDAAHPFAVNLHKNIARAAENCEIETIRLERRLKETGDSTDGLIWCESIADAISKMKNDGVKKLLALTGVQTIPAFKTFNEGTDIYFRILNRENSIEKALKAGIDRDKIIYYDADDPGAEQYIAELKPDAIITKESGDSGGTELKIKAAQNANIPLYIIKRPKLPLADITVYGGFGLRRAVEKMLPRFFDLRSGFTTGSCATAAAIAALKVILGEEFDGIAEFELPNGELMEMAVAEWHKINDNTASATVIKEAGDDPDVTDGCRITVIAEKTDGGNIVIEGGEGVGRVSLPGLGINIGDAAINRVPRLMIENNVRRLYLKGGLKVTISVENGEEIAKKTFNPKVGVEGGISIIGSSGIVMPYSHEAFVESIRREINVALASGCRKLVINSGAKSEKAVRIRFSTLPSQSFIHYGNAIGETLEAAEKAGVQDIAMGIMIGKAVKMAEGHLNTHSHNVSMNREFIIAIAKETGLNENIIQQIAGIKLARELWDIIPEEKREAFFGIIKDLCKKQVGKIFRGKIEIILIEEEKN